jgi:hypothetical protein
MALCSMYLKKSMMCSNKKSTIATATIQICFKTQNEYAARA